MHYVKSWDPVVEKFLSKLALWKAKTLSIGGRITLIKAVLSSIPLYYFSLFKAPDLVIKKLHQIHNRFLWTGTDEVKKIHWINWERIMAPKTMGGLGIGSLKSANLALLAKWWWKAKKDDSSLWAKMIAAIHNNNNGLFLPCTKSLASPWKTIASIDKDCGEFGVDLMGCFNQDSNGVWIWLNGTADYSSKSLKALIENNIFSRQDVILYCNNLVPIKVNFTVWRILLDRLPTFDAFLARQVSVENALCPMYGLYYENVNHMFYRCSFANHVWSIIQSWLGPPSVKLSNYEDMRKVITDLKWCEKKIKMVWAICFVTLWCIWNARNKKVHSNVNNDIRRLIEDVKAQSFFWVKNRLKCKNLVINNWCNFVISDVTIPTN